MMVGRQFFHPSPGPEPTPPPPPPSPSLLPHLRFLTGKNPPKYWRKSRPEATAAVTAITRATASVAGFRHCADSRMVGVVSETRPDIFRHQHLVQVGLRHYTCSRMVGLVSDTMSTQLGLGWFQTLWLGSGWSRWIQTLQFFRMVSDTALFSGWLRHCPGCRMVGAGRLRRSY